MKPMRLAFLFLLMFECGAFAAPSTVKPPPFKKFLDSFPDVFCQQSDQCPDSFFLTGEDCKGYLKKQISQKYANRKFRVSLRKVNTCLDNLAKSSCDSLKTVTPKSCGFLDKLD